MPQVCFMSFSRAVPLIDFSSPKDANGCVFFVVQVTRMPVDLFQMGIGVAIPRALMEHLFTSLLLPDYRTNFLPPDNPFRPEPIALSPSKQENAPPCSVRGFFFSFSLPFLQRGGAGMASFFRLSSSEAPLPPPLTPVPNRRRWMISPLALRSSPLTSFRFPSWHFSLPLRLAVSHDSPSTHEKSVFPRSPRFRRWSFLQSPPFPFFLNHEGPRFPETSLIIALFPARAMKWPPQQPREVLLKDTHFPRWAVEPVPVFILS